VTAMI